MVSSSAKSDPGKALPRDPTGSYLHLKLKRFKSIKKLTMPYAKKTWQQMPHDAGVEMAPNARASCRQCHNKIEKDELRYQLLLQCHKGCKISAFFHSDCIWKYPETAKIAKLEEFVGFDDLPQKEKKRVMKDFEKFAKANKKHETTASKKAPSRVMNAKRKSASDGDTQSTRKIQKTR